VASIYKRHQTLWAKYRDASGAIVRNPTKYRVGQEELALRYARRKEELAVERRTKAAGIQTVKTYTDKWIKARSGRVATWKDEQSRLRRHLVPTLGSMRLDAVKPRHVRDWVLKLREGELAPRTVRHVFQTFRRMMQSAYIEELVIANPVVVDKGVLPKNVDADPAWRQGAIYTRAEVQRLISEPELGDRRLRYALQALGGLRSGEAARLRWRDYEPDVEPLGRLSLLKTKMGVPRQVPVHPVLAAMLAEAKLERKPDADDLIISGERVPWQLTREAADDLVALGMRHRRAHDLRRTFISLAREDGARADLLEIVTHGPKQGDMISLYSTFPWSALCGEVAKLKVSRVASSDVAVLHEKPGHRSGTLSEKANGPIAQQDRATVS
jgi:integrase